MHGKKRTYDLVRKIEFTSERKRASVIVKLDQQYAMFSKGADSVIEARLHASYHEKTAAGEQLAKTDKFLEMASR